MISALKQRVLSGAEIGRRMVPVRSRREIGQILGISFQAVAIIEKRALHKLSLRMKEAVGHMEI